jgi:phenylacetate-CoA ligase
MSRSAIRITVHAGEPGASIPETRRRIQEAFGAKTFDHVGMTEMGAYGFECETQSGMHINEDEFIAEMIDPKTLGPNGEGEKGELVLSNLGRVGMPVIRYRTGDLGVISREPCACGRLSARLIGGVLGRADDMITIRGINVFPSAIENIVRRHPQVVEFAIEVHCQREMHGYLKVETRPAEALSKDWGRNSPRPPRQHPARRG